MIAIRAAVAVFVFGLGAYGVTHTAVEGWQRAFWWLWLGAAGQLQIDRLAEHIKRRIATRDRADFAERNRRGP